MPSDSESKKKTYVSPILKKLPLTQARRMLEERVSCGDQDASRLYEELPADTPGNKE